VEEKEYFHFFLWERAAVLGTKNWPQNSSENCQLVVSEQLD